MQPSPPIKKCIYEEEGGGLFQNMGHASVMSPKQVYD
jgi:hypothetical protein